LAPSHPLGAVAFLPKAGIRAHSYGYSSGFSPDSLLKATPYNLELLTKIDAKVGRKTGRPSYFG